MTDWKAITIDHSFIDGLDNTTDIPICLTEQQIAIIKACLVPAYWPTRWRNLTIPDKALFLAMSEIDYRLNGNTCSIGDTMQLRENPADPCEVQYSNDDGATWQTAFYKNTCIQAPSNATSITTINNSQTTVTQNNTTYAGDIANVALSWVFNGNPTEDGLRDTALCWAIRKHVQWVCETRINQINEGNQHLKDIADFVTDVTTPLNAIAVTAATMTAGIPGGLVAACAWTVGRIWVNVIAESLSADASVFEDQEARDAVACWMYKSLKGQTPTFTRWQSSLTGFYDANPNAMTIADSVNVVNQEEDFYVNYLMLVNDINSVAESLPVCQCPDTWERTWNFVTHPGAWAANGWSVRTKGTYVEGEGVVGGIHLVSGDESMTVWNVDPGAIIHPSGTSAHYHLSIVKGKWRVNGNAVIMYRNPGSLITLNQGSIFTGDHTFNCNFSVTPVTALDNQFRASQADDGNVGSIILRAITWRGTGNDPYSSQGDTGQWPTAPFKPE